MTEQKPPSMVPGYVLTGCGCLLALASLAVAAFFGFHVFFDRGGAISGREAEPGLAGGACCALGSLAIFAAGGVVLYLAKQKAKAFEAEQQQPPSAGAPPAPGAGAPPAPPAGPQ